MSSRITRSSARQSANSASLSNPESITRKAKEQKESSNQEKPPATARKRKSSITDIGGGEQSEEQEGSSSARRAKRAKHTENESPTAPSSSRRQSKSKIKAKAKETMNSPSEQQEKSTAAMSTPATSSSSRRKSGKAKAIPSEAQDASSSKRTRKSPRKSENTVKATPSLQREEKPVEDEKPAEMAQDNDDDDDEGEGDGEDDDMEEHDFDGWLGGRGGGPGGSGISSTLRALSGMMSGMNGRFRGMLESIKQKEDPTMQLIGLQNLSEMLLVSTEDTLAGYFSPDLYIKELVPLMQPDDFTGEENPEMMLLACRCIANMMEALPASTAAVVYGGAVPVLLSKLVEIQYMDLAEQALLTLEKISVEFPASIVREGGLSACLMYLDFFPTSTQRTAVTTAANCSRNIPGESFESMKDVMPILQNVLNNSDQRVVEQGCLCVSRIVESFRFEDAKLEGLMSADLLRAILRLLVPASTNMIGPHIQTQFLKVLAHTARASPTLTAELLKMNVVDTLFQMLTGVSPPGGLEDVAQKIDSVMIMQALIHRPKDQVFETLNVICELLPDAEGGTLGLSDELAELFTDYNQYSRARRSITAHRPAGNKLADCKPELRRFAVVLFPTLTDAYASTVNLNVRQKVLTAHIKMLSDLDSDILEDALRSVPYASFLASIISQQDHSTLVVLALRASELLLKRLESIYRYQFYREGVIAEVRKLAERELAPVIQAVSPSPAAISGSLPIMTAPAGVVAAPQPNVEAQHEDSDDEEGDEDMGDHEDDEDDASSDEEELVAAMRMPKAAGLSVQDLITKFAQRLLAECESEQGAELRTKAASRLQALRSLITDISTAYDSGKPEEGAKLFKKLTQYFDGDDLESITSHELMTSNLVDRFLDIFQDREGQANDSARAAFVEAFMSSTVAGNLKATTSESPPTPFSSLVHKLQDLLSRAEHFEVLTVHSNTSDTSRSSAVSMLAKQIRVKLVADEASGIPKPYRNITVSIHAIATFKALDDYLRPRISMADRPRPPRNQDPAALSSAYSAAMSSLKAATEEARRMSGLPGNSAPASRKEATGKSSRSKSRADSAQQAAATPDTSMIDTPTARKSGRKSSSTQHKSTSAAEATPAQEETQATLECADEAPLEDDEDEGMGDETLNALVDDLEDGMELDEEDPSAVNLEVASSGKVTARQEDGTRIATPAQGATPTKPPPSKPYSNEMARALLSQMSGRAAMSYAAALQTAPQDWHLEFSVNGQPISNETTIYRAVHNMQPTSETASRNIWAAVHSVDIKKVSGPASAEPATLNNTPEPTALGANGMPESLENNPATASILRLLGILHNINTNLDDVMLDTAEPTKISPEPLTQFVNTKLTAKLNRQLEEPLVVASNCLPGWSEDLARLYPFLFPFETRHLFLQSTSYGYSRSMTRWQDSQSSNDSRRNRHRDERPYLGRLQRQKVRISRNKILESAVKVMELYGASPSILEVEYFEEVGTGLGPTLEFYSTVSKEFSKKKFRLWRENDANTGDEYAFGVRGLYPAPMSETQSGTENGQKVLTLFKMLGKFVARSMLDSRMIDVSFNPAFFRFDRNAGIPPLSSIKAVDHDLYKSLLMLRQFYTAKRTIEEHPRLTAAQKEQKIAMIQINGASIDDLALDFTLPGYPHIEIIPNGAQLPVTIDNVAIYIAGVVDYTTGKGVQQQIEMFREGFSQVFPYSALRAFTAEELTMLYGRNEEDWSMETLMDSIKADHGFNLDSPAVRSLLQVMTELSPTNKRDFLQFVSGSPKLPIGGFKSLTPMLTVVCKPAEAPLGSDDYLPSVMTCVNYLKLPNYSTLDVMREKITLAIREGQGAFHLS